MENIVYKYIKNKNLLAHGDSVLIGLSGGADSVALFFVLLSLRHRMNLKLFVAHINHNVRGSDALADELFCVNLCKSNSIPIQVFNVDMLEFAAEKKLSSEEAGRLLRYQAFSKAAIFFNANKIAVAHNKNDQAETVLLHLIRGAGTRGLSAMKPQRDNIIRPLLCMERQEIEKYLVKNRQSFRHDKTNDTDNYSRNIIRHHLIPLIENKLNPNITDSLCRTAEIISEDSDYIKHEIETAYKASVYSVSTFNYDTGTDNANTPYPVNINELLNYPSPIISGVISLMYRVATGTTEDLSHININQVKSLITGTAKNGKLINLPHNVEAYIEYDKLFVRKRQIPGKNIIYSYILKPEKITFVPETGCYVLLTGKEIQFSNTIYTKTLNYASIKGDIELRSRRDGDKIYIDNVGAKKLSDFFIDRKMPKDERDVTPLLVIDGVIACIAAKTSGAAFYNSRFTATPETRHNEKIHFIYWEAR